METRPIVAICYDFDKTLSPNDMQAQGFLQTVGFEEAAEFWKQSNEVAYENEMDQNSAWMFKMVKEARGKELFTRQRLQEYGAGVSLFPGVDTWFSRIDEYAAEHGVVTEHYIISSGLREMIEGTEIYKRGVFKKVYASSFLFDDDGVAVWPAQVVNYTNKTQFLFRIEKGVLDVNDQRVNDKFPPEKVRVPFRNMIYIGDSDTDIPCMKLVNSYGGHSIGVFDPVKDDRTKVYGMMKDERIRYFAPADYGEGSELETLVRRIIDKTYAAEILERIYYEKVAEADAAYAGDGRGKDERERDILIDKLGSSMNFMYTREVVAEMAAYPAGDWTEAQKAKLLRIAQENDQVALIMDEDNIKSFFDNIEG